MFECGLVLAGVGKKIVMVQNRGKKKSRAQEVFI